MAKLSVKVRQLKREKMVAKYAQRRADMKAAGDWAGLDKLPKDASPVRLHSRCRLSGRPRGFMRKFGVSRIVFRDLARAGKIPGVTKASW